MSAQSRRRRLSPSLIVASLALIVASSGSAVAAALITGKQIKDESVTGKDIKNGSLAFKELDSAAKKKTTKIVTPLWALVDLDGTLLRGKGVVTVERSTNGQYFVTFNRKVYDSAVSVSVVNEGAGAGQVNFRYCANIPSGLTCGFSLGQERNNTIFVNTEDSAGANADRRFIIVVNPGGIDFGDAPAPRPASPKAEAGAEGTR